MPLFLSRNSTLTIQHSFHNLQRSKFPYGCADVAKETGRKGSNVYEVNLWLWCFGRGKPRMGGLSVSETEGLVTKFQMPSYSLSAVLSTKVVFQSTIGDDSDGRIRVSQALQIGSA